MRADADRERVLKALEEVGEPTSPQVIAEVLELTQPTIRRHLNTLRDRGAVTRTGAGKKGDPYQWEPVSTEAGGGRP
jgi:predicted ArsR family transcriptional regulator